MALLRVMLQEDRPLLGLRVWGRLRPIMYGKGVSRTSALTALLGLKGSGSVLFPAREDLR
jgi:hypothetical protein